MASVETEKYKNVKKIGKSLPNGGRSLKKGSVASSGIEALLSGKIEDFLMDNAQNLIQRYGGDINLNDIKTTARRYAREYPVLTVVGAAAIGMAAGLWAVNTWAGSTGSRQR